MSGIGFYLGEEHMIHLRKNQFQLCSANITKAQKLFLRKSTLGWLLTTGK